MISMLNYQGLKKNSGQIFYVGLTQQADTKLLQANPTIAAGDFKVSIDGGALNNLGTLPTVTPAAGRAVKITLSAAELNGDNIMVLCVDAAGAEWCDLAINIQTVPVDASLVQVDGVANINATLNLTKLNVVNSGGDAGVFSSTGSNGHGLKTTGNGTGNGHLSQGGATGHGFRSQGGATSGHGIFTEAQTLGAGLVANAVGATQNGIQSTGSSGGAGIYGTGNGAGAGITSQAGATGNGFYAIGGSASGHGIVVAAVGAGVGLLATGVGNVSIQATQGISGPLDASERNAIADAHLKRDMTLVAGPIPNKSPMNAIRSQRSWSISGATLTVNDEVGNPAYTSPLTTSALAVPVISML